MSLKMRPYAILWLAVLGLSLGLCSGDEAEERKQILDELLSQARAARDESEAPHREPNDLLRDTTSDTDASSYSMLDHLLDKAMKEKVSRESDPGNPEPSDYLQNSEMSFMKIKMIPNNSRGSNICFLKS